ncbi:hypothetical protein [Actinacidiphila glaucinigra]
MEQSYCARYQQLPEPWVDQTMDYAARIHPEVITAYRLTANGGPAARFGM